MPREQYTVEPIDVDGDGIPDGDMVTKYVNGKVVSRKFVPMKKIQQIVAKSMASSAASSASRPKKARAPPSATQGMVYASWAGLGGGCAPTYKRLPEVQESNKPVLVQDSTGFAQYVKAGAGMEAGRLATDAVVDGLEDLF
jgi:hypothetical protein